MGVVTLSPTPASLLVTAPGVMSVSLSVTSSPHDFVLLDILNIDTPPLPAEVDFGFGSPTGSTSFLASEPFTTSIYFDFPSGMIEGIYRIILLARDSSGGFQLIHYVINILPARRRFRDALSDITLTTHSLSNSGLINFNADMSFPGDLGAGLPYSGGIINHNGLLAAQWHWTDNDGVRGIGVATYEEETDTWSFLGNPFVAGSTDVSYSASNPTAPILDITGVPETDDEWGAMVALHSDDTNLFCVCAVLIDEGDLFPPNTMTYGDGSPAVNPGTTSSSTYTQHTNSTSWKLACKKWNGGTSWIDWGWDNSVVANGHIRHAYKAFIDGSKSFGSAGWTGDGDVTMVASCASAAEPGIVRAVWQERGFDPVEQWGAGYNAHSTNYVWAPYSAQSLTHNVKFTGPGSASVTLHDVQQSINNRPDFPDGFLPSSIGCNRLYFDNDGDGDSNFWTPSRYGTFGIYGTRLFDSFPKFVAASDGGIPLMVSLWHDPITDAEWPATSMPDRDDFWTFQIMNIDDFTVVNTTPPDGGTSSINTDGFFSIGTLFYLLWDPIRSVYWTTWRRPGGGFITPDYLAQLTSLTVDGLTWTALTRPFTSTDVSQLYSTAYSPNVDLGEFRCTSVEEIDVWGIADALTYHGIECWAWIPCPSPGPYDNSAWHVVYPYASAGTVSNYQSTSAVSDDPFAPPTTIPFGPYVPTYGGEFAGSAPDRSSVQIGDIIYTMVNESDDFRVYGFKIARNFDGATCPVTLGSSGIDALSIERFRFRAWEDGDA